MNDDNSLKVCKIKVIYDIDKQVFYAISNIPSKHTVVSVGRTADELIRNFDRGFMCNLNDAVDKELYKDTGDE